MNPLSKSHNDTPNRKNDVEEQYASVVEKVIATVVAPNILSNSGRTAILAAWVIMGIWSGYGIAQIKTTFSVEFFIPKDTDTWDYHMMDLKYFETGMIITTLVDNDEIDYASEETQL